MTFRGLGALGGIALAGMLGFGGNVAVPTDGLACNPIIAGPNRYNCGVSVGAGFNAVNELLRQESNDTALSAATASPTTAIPLLNVYASGALAHTSHDGFIQDASTSGKSSTSSFDVLEYSIFANIQADLSKYFGDSGLRVKGSIHAGYAAADAELDANPAVGLNSDGSTIDSDAGILGGTLSFQQGFTYWVMSATGFLGENKANFVSGATADYNFSGFLGSIVLGKIHDLGNNTYFDPRIGLKYSTYRSEDHAVRQAGTLTSVDDAGIEELLGMISAGLFRVYDMGGLTTTVYGRAAFEYRLDYDNEANVRGTLVEFTSDDAFYRFSFGANLRPNDMYQFAAEAYVRGTGDQTTLGGKLKATANF